MLAAIDITGDVEARYIMSVSAKAQKTVARVMLYEENVDNEPAEILEDSVMELVNVICGNAAAECSLMGKNVTISPPFMIQPNASAMIVEQGQHGLCFPLLSDDDEKMDMIILIKN